MKNLLLIIFFLPILVTAQNTEGKIIYQETIPIKIDAEGLTEEMRKMIPTEQSSSNVLYFNAEASLYKGMEEDQEMEHSGESGGGTFKMVIAKPDNQYYKDLENQKLAEKKEFFGRNFLIEEELKAYSWKLTGQQKKVGKYVCQQATAQKDTISIEAWFAPQIPVSSGPASFGGLPGMILEVNYNQGQIHFIATDVSFEAPEKGLIVAPKKGKKISREEFDKIREEKMKELQTETGGSNAIIKVRSSRN